MVCSASPPQSTKRLCNFDVIPAFVLSLHDQIDRINEDVVHICRCDKETNSNTTALAASTSFLCNSYVGYDKLRLVRYHLRQMQKLFKDAEQLLSHCH